MKNYYLFIIISLCCLGCTKLEDPTRGVNINDIFSITLDKEYVLANSQDFVNINVTLKELCDPNYDVSFEIDNGKFSGVAPDKNNDEGKKMTIKASGKFVQARLISDNKVVDKVTIRVSLGLYKKDTTIIFIAANPDDLELIPDKHRIKADGIDKGIIKVNATRLAGKGKVSDDIKIYLNTESADTVKNHVPSYCSLLDETGEFSIYSINNKPGVVTIKATFIDDNNKTKTKTIPIEFY
ncbi:MAG: hypothetical protein NTZ69_02705 [Bacteroidia bacterium]|nr:hypothetical protein [Bacteroidia bacterium]